MSDTLISVVLALDLFGIILGVKLIVRLLAILKQLPPPARLAPGPVPLVRRAPRVAFNVPRRKTSAAA